jgi:hypothetical protein
LMDEEWTDQIIKEAERETLSHLRFMRRSIHLDLLFTLLLIIVLAANDQTAIAMGFSPGRWEEIGLFLTPPPLLFVALAISAAIESYILRGLKKDLKELSKHGAGPVGSSNAIVGKSITDINYEMVRAMERSMRIWPIVAFLFVLYFAESAGKIAGWTLGVLPALSFNWTAILNTIVLILAIVFFLVQTKRWMARRKHLKRLRKMEMTVLEELHIR